MSEDTVTAESSTGLLRWWPLLIGLLTLLSRFCFRSDAYYVDGPRHVAAILSGTVLIQPPGYFLFGETGRLLVRFGGASPSEALFLLNAVFTAAGAAVFSLLALRFFAARLAVLLSLFYGLSVTVWFDGEIHSTYAAMTFFVPLLLYVLLVRENYWLGGGAWALMAGFRPSDGVFVLPFLVWLLYRKGRRFAWEFALAAVPFVALWYIPTVEHFGGHWLSPLHSARDQAGFVANGLLVPGIPWARKIGNLIHIATGMYNAWSIFTPLLFLGLSLRTALSRLVLLWLLPGTLFFTLYFFSDSVYLSYMVAPGLLVIGETLQRFAPRRAVQWVAAGLLLSVGQMIFARPVVPTTMAKAVFNSYLLQYSGWAIRHQYHQRLQDAVTTLHGGSL